ncbi:MAG: hypothetical protein WCC64_15360 [Aliidongia sp.]
MQEAITADAGNGMVLTIGAQPPAGPMPGAPQPVAATPDPGALARSIADKARVVTFTDSFGRVIELKKLSVSKRLRLLDLLGTKPSNQLLNYATAAAGIISINGESVGTNPTTRLMLDALLDRLDEQGVAEVFVRYAEEFLGATFNKADDEGSGDSKLGD